MQKKLALTAAEVDKSESDNEAENPECNDKADDSDSNKAFVGNKFNSIEKKGLFLKSGFEIEKSCHVSF